MSNMLQRLLGLWGAALATALAVLELARWFRDKPRIRVHAELRFQPVDRGAVAKGTLVETDHGPNEVLLTVTAVNCGRQALQILGCLVEERNGSIYQVVPEGLPAVLEPNTRVDVDIQKEWLDGEQAVRFGVVDALGRVHKVREPCLKQLVERCNNLPSGKREYRHRESGETVVAFQAHDKAILSRPRKKGEHRTNS